MIRCNEISVVVDHYVRRVGGVREEEVVHHLIRWDRYVRRVGGVREE